MSVKNIFLWIWVVLMTVVSATCKPQKKESYLKKTSTTDHAHLSEYKADNYIWHGIKLPPKGNEKGLKVEIIPGVFMLVDNCNRYGLQGSFEKRIDAETNAMYYFFKSEGNVFHTDMGCPTDSMRTEFVGGMPILVDYSSPDSIMLYLPRSIGFKINIWKVSETVSLPLKQDEKLLADFPLPYLTENYDGYVISMSEKISGDKIELIPGIQMMVDCNEYWLTSNGFGVGGSINFPYPYYTFDSNRTTASTHKQCPDGKTSRAFVHPLSPYTLPLEKKEPVVVFIPKGFELKYRVWKAGK